jgi:hypothetical protein
MFIIEKIKKWLEQGSYASELERYITSKNPTNAAEVEHYAKQYQLRQNGGLL